MSLKTLKIGLIYTLHTLPNFLHHLSSQHVFFNLYTMATIVYLAIIQDYRIIMLMIYYHLNNYKSLATL